MTYFTTTNGIGGKKKAKGAGREKKRGVRLTSMTFFPIPLLCARERGGIGRKGEGRGRICFSASKE